MDHKIEPEPGAEPPHSAQLQVLSYNIHSCFPVIVALFEDYKAIIDYNIIAIQEPWLNRKSIITTTYRAGNAINF
jgi:endonuclease/exonuclease/phosphatase family metal-dependent hydrolase